MDVPERGKPDTTIIVPRDFFLLNIIVPRPKSILRDYNAEMGEIFYDYFAFLLL